MKLPHHIPEIKTGLKAEKHTQAPEEAGDNSTPTRYTTPEDVG
jgi:hypothetical protein